MYVVVVAGAQRAFAAVLPAGVVPRHRAGAPHVRAARLVQEVRVQRVGPALRLRHTRHLDRDRRHGEFMPRLLP